jgi:hypothetical protein
MVHDGSDVPERRRTPRWQPRGGVTFAVAASLGARLRERASEFVGPRAVSAAAAGWFVQAPAGASARHKRETARFRSRQSSAGLLVRHGGRSLLT